MISTRLAVAGLSFLVLLSACEFINSIEQAESVEEVGFDFVRVEAGTFNFEADPYRQVTISQDYFLTRTEVTQAQWESVMGKRPRHHAKCDDCPVEDISWNDIQRFIARLNELEGADLYRMPTSAEWEYAARAGTQTSWSFGDDASRLPEYAWIVSNSKFKPHPVAQKKPNLWGFYDMHGNVSELVFDWDRTGTFILKPETDPTGPESGTYKVFRGAHYGSPPEHAHVNVIGSVKPDERHGSVGFRLLKEVEDESAAPNS